MQNISEFIVDYLAERGAEISLENYQDYDFISAGIIDSFETLSFLLVLEQEFGVRVPPEDFVDKNYRITGQLVEFIVSQQAD